MISLGTWCQSFKGYWKTPYDPVRFLHLAFDFQPGFVNPASFLVQVYSSVAKDGGKPPVHICIIINAL